MNFIYLFYTFIGIKFNLKKKDFPSFSTVQNLSAYIFFFVLELLNFFSFFLILYYL